MNGYYADTGKIPEQSGNKCRMLLDLKK